MDTCVFCIMCGDKNHKGSCVNFEVYYRKYSDPNQCKWYIFGKYFGYPECCIKNFIKNFNKLKTGKMRKYKSNYFIQCDKHLEIVDDKNVIINLNKRRKCLTSFPDDKTVSREVSILETLLITYYD